MRVDQERHEREVRAGRLRKARVSAGFRGPTAVAEKLNINVNTYKAHENGRNGFGVSDARAYANLFGVSIKWLYFGIGAPTDKVSAREELATVFEKLADAPEYIQSRVLDFAEFELERLEKSRETEANPVS